MSEIIVRTADAAADLQACFDIRVAVFCGEQGVSREIEFDGLDDVCRHFLALDADRPVGTARTRPLGDGTVKFERIAVLGDARRRNAGRLLVEYALETAAADGFTTAMMHAQTYARPFYEKLGFAQQGDGFMEAGIPHIRMARPVARAAGDTHRA